MSTDKRPAGVPSQPQANQIHSGTQTGNISVGHGQSGQGSQGDKIEIGKKKPTAGNERGFMNTHHDGIKKVAELIKDIKYVMLTTITEHGHVHSRPMTTQDMEFDGTVWFFISKSSTIVDDIRYSHEVNLAYSEPKKNHYVSLCGAASLVDDMDKKEELWKPALAAWFPQGVHDPELTLLKIDAHSAHYWDSPAASVVYLMGMAKAYLTGKPFTGEGTSQGDVDFQH